MGEKKGVNHDFLNKEKSRDVQEERKLFLAERVKPRVKKKINFSSKRGAGNVQPTTESRTKRNQMKEPVQRGIYLLVAAEKGLKVHVVPERKPGCIGKTNGETGGMLNKHPSTSIQRIMFK